MTAPTIDDQIRCVKREISQRGHVYPRLVSVGKMKQADADREINTMAAVLATLERLRDEQRPGLF